MAKIDDLRIEPDQTVPARRLPRPRATTVTVVAALALGLSAVIWFAVRGLRAGAGEDEVRGAAPSGPATAAAAPQETPPPVAVTAGGYVEVIPPGPTVVATRIAGWVQTVAVTEGARVEPGQVLVTLEDDVHRQALAEAEADVALALAQLVRLRAGFRGEEIAESAARERQVAARVDYARAEVERSEKLVALGAAPERQLLAARAEHDAAEADLAAARALLELRRAGQRPEDIAVAEAELARARTRQERLQWQLDQCVVRAPAAGVVLERFVKVGDWVAPAQDGGRAGALLTVFDPQRLQVWVEINQRDAGRIAVGQAASLRADAWEGRAVAGRVVQIMPSANLQRNTVEVKVAFTPDAADGASAAAGDSAFWLRPQMSVQVTFLADEPPRETRRTEDDAS